MTGSSEVTGMTGALYYFYSFDFVHKYKLTRTVFTGVSVKMDDAKPSTETTFFSSRRQSRRLYLVAEASGRAIRWKRGTVLS